MLSTIFLDILYFFVGSNMWHFFIIFFNKALLDEKLFIVIIKEGFRLDIWNLLADSILSIFAYTTYVNAFTVFK